MGGSNQSLFLLSALFIGQGNISARQRRHIAADLRAAAQHRGRARLDGVGADLSEPRRRHRRRLFRSLWTLQSHPRQPGGRRLLVGMGADLRPDRAALRFRDPSMVSAPCAVPTLAIGLVLSFAAINLCGIKWVSRAVIPIAAASSLLGVSLRPAAHHRRRSRLASGHHLSPDHAFLRLVRLDHQPDGRPLPHRLRRASLRGRHLPCRRGPSILPAKCLAPFWSAP